MPTHDHSHEAGQRLCDGMFAQLSSQLPRLQRDKKNSCGLYCEGGHRFAYVYHRSKTPDVRIYFRGDPDVVPSSESPCELRSRPSFKSNWDKRFPHFFDVGTERPIEEVTRFLLKFSVPLTLNRKSGNRDTDSSQRQINTIEEIDPILQLREGATKRVMVNVFERNPTARRICIETYGCRCFICDFDFARVYGEIGADYIQVHHLKPLTSIGLGYRVDPVADLRAVCANCHAIIHRSDPPLRCDQVRQLISSGPYGSGQSDETVVS